MLLALAFAVAGDSTIPEVAESAVDPAPVAPPRPPPAPRRGKRQDSLAPERVRIGGDFQANFVAERLERMGDEAYAANPPRPTFTVAHLRPRMEYNANAWLSMRAAVEMANYPESPPEDPELLGDSLAIVEDGEPILKPSVDEMFVKLQSDGFVRQSLRLGVMHTSFGLRDSYDRFDGFFMGGQLAYMEPERRFGISPGVDIGVAYRIALPKIASLDVQVINGSGVYQIDSTAAKDIVARLTVRPIDAVEVRGSVMRAGKKDDGHTRGAFSLELSARQWLPAIAPRLVGQWVTAREAAGGIDTDRYAILGAGAFDIPLKNDVTDHLTVLGSFSAFDPDFRAGGADLQDVYDALFLINAGTNLYWNTEGDEPRRDKSVDITSYLGIVYEQLIPQDETIPISHSVVLHAGISR